MSWSGKGSLSAWPEKTEFGARSAPCGVFRVSFVDYRSKFAQRRKFFEMVAYKEEDLFASKNAK